MLLLLLLVKIININETITKIEEKKVEKETKISKIRSNFFVSFSLMMCFL